MLPVEIYSGELNVPEGRNRSSKPVFGAVAREKRAPAAGKQRGNNRNAARLRSPDNLHGVSSAGARVFESFTPPSLEIVKLLKTVLLAQAAG